MFGTIQRVTYMFIDRRSHDELALPSTAATKEPRRIRLELVQRGKCDSLDAGHGRGGMDLGIVVVFSIHGTDTFIAAT
jgi:hypothetical protein